MSLSSVGFSRGLSLSFYKEVTVYLTYTDLQQSLSICNNSYNKYTAYKLG